MQKSYEKRPREKGSNKASVVREPASRPEVDSARFGGNNAMKDVSGQSARSHWNKLWVPPSGNDWGKRGGQQHFQQLSGSNVHSQWNDAPPFHHDFQFHERRSPENHFNSHAPPLPMGEPLANNSLPWASPNVFPPVPNQLEQLEELHAYYQFKLKKLQKQKKQSHDDIRQLNQLASLLKESLVLHDLSMKQQQQQQQDFGYPLLDPLFNANPLRVNEMPCNGAIFYDQNLDFLQSQPAGWRPNEGRLGAKEVWGAPSAPLSIPNRGQLSRTPEPLDFGRKSPGSGSPKAVSDFPGPNIMARDYSQARSKSDVNSVFLPSQDELDFHLAMVQLS